MVRTGRLRTSDRRTRLLGRGAKQRGEQVPESFTALFTARDGGVPVGSAAGCGPFPTCYRSHKLLGHSRGHGRDLERRQFSPVKTEVISVTLKDKSRLNNFCQDGGNTETSPLIKVKTNVKPYAILETEVLPESLHSDIFLCMLNQEGRPFRLLAVWYSVPPLLAQHRIIQRA